MSKTVLIIDDEDWFLEPILERMDSEGITYDYCGTGYEGLSKISSEDYKVVVLDMKVSLGKELKDVIAHEPAAGIYVVEEIKKKKSELPVICYTVLSDEEVVSKIKELGGKHLAKGSMEDVTTLIEEIKRYA